MSFRDKRIISEYEPEEDDKRINWDAVDVDDCERMYKLKNYRVILSNGSVVGFVEEEDS